MPDLAGFRFFLRQAGRKESTIRTTTYSVEQVLNKVNPLTAENFRVWLASESERGISNSYLNHFISGLRVYARFVGNSELAQMAFLKEKEYLKSTLSDEEIENFLKILPPSITYKHHISGTQITRHIDPVGYGRWTIFFSIMAYTGMRPGEVANLTIDAVDFGREVFILEDTKTNTPRFVPIPPNIFETVREYVGKCPDTYLFPSQRGGCTYGNVVDDVDWGYAFHSRMKRLGIKRKNLTPYSLRHSLITRLLEEDVNLFKVQKLVGHRQIETTAHYTHLTTKDLIETIKKHPLVRRGTDPHEILRSLGEMIESFELEKDKRINSRIVKDDNSLIFEAKICSETD